MSLRKLYLLTGTIYTWLCVVNMGTGIVENVKEWGKNFGYEIWEMEVEVFKILPSTGARGREWQYHMLGNSDTVTYHRHAQSSSLPLLVLTLQFSLAVDHFDTAAEMATT